MIASFHPFRDIGNFVLLNTSCLNPLITYPYKATPEVMTSTVDKTLGKNEGQRSMCLRTPSAAHSPLASAAFKNHGKVNVHFVGPSASAANISSLGKTYISICIRDMCLDRKYALDTSLVVISSINLS